MAGYRGGTELTKTERSRHLTPFEEMERWFGDFWRRPFSLLTPTMWPEKVEKGDYYRYERSHGSFFRRFELPFDVDAEKVKAHLEHGVLEVRVPKTEEMKGKSKKVAIS
jgi:hypothetical protein